MGGVVTPARKICYAWRVHENEVAGVNEQTMKNGSIKQLLQLLVVGAGVATLIQGSTQ